MGYTLFFVYFFFFSASDIFASGPLSRDVDKYHVTGLSLQEATLYYSSVTAEGASGLVSWDVSDGVLLDTEAPQAGLVMDGTGKWLNPLTGFLCSQLNTGNSHRIILQMILRFESTCRDLHELIIQKG